MPTTSTDPGAALAAVLDLLTARERNARLARRGVRAEYDVAVRAARNGTLTYYDLRWFQHASTRAAARAEEAVATLEAARRLAVGWSAPICRCCVDNECECQGARIVAERGRGARIVAERGQ